MNSTKTGSREEGPGQGSAEWESWHAEHRRAVAMIATTQGVETLSRLGATLSRACGDLAQHLSAASPGPEHDLLDRLVSVVGSALAEVRLGRFRLLARAEAERGPTTIPEACGTARGQTEEVDPYPGGSHG